MTGTMATIAIWLSCISSPVMLPVVPSLTGWEASSRGTAVSVELYVLDPYSDAAHDLRELREAGPVAMPLAAVAAPAPAKDATDGNRGELVEVEVTGAEGTERGMAAPEDVEVGVIRPKTKGAKALEALHLTAERRKRLGNSLQIRARITQVKRLLYAQLEVVEDARSTFRYKPTISTDVVLDVVRIKPEWLLVTRSHIGFFVRIPLDSRGFKSGEVTPVQRPPQREPPGPEDINDGFEPVIRYVPVRRIFRHAGDSVRRPRRFYAEFVRMSDREEIESDEIIRRCGQLNAAPGAPLLRLLLTSRERERPLRRPMIVHEQVAMTLYALTTLERIERADAMVQLKMLCAGLPVR